MKRRTAATLRQLTFGLFAAFTFCSSLASADGEPPSAARMEAAKERFRKGVALSDQAEVKHDPALYEAALVEYKQAYAIWPKDSILWNMAICELETKRHLDALRHFKEYEKSSSALTTPNHPDREELKKYLAQLRALTGHVKVQATPGSHILVDKKDVAVAPVEDAIDVLPGRHTLESDGRTAIVVVAAGEEARVMLVDEPGGREPAGAPSASSGVTVESSIHRDAPMRARFWTTPRVIGAVTFGVGVGAIATGIGFGRLAAGASSDAGAIGLGRSSCFGNANDPTCAEYASRRSDQDGYHSLAVAFVGAGAAAAVVGAGIFLFWPSPPRSIALVPIVTPHEAGLAFRGAL